MITIWGRANSINVQKVLWCCDELGLEIERIDAGRGYGHIDSPEYYLLNPNRRVPTLVDGDFVLWESHAILRYLAAQYGADGLYPDAIRPRTSVDRWLDWVLSTLAGAALQVNTAYFGMPPEKRDITKTAEGLQKSGPVWKIVNEQLAGRLFVEGNNFTIADIALGVYVRRWFGVPEVDIPHFEHLAAWYRRLEDRPGLQRCFVL